MADGQSPISVFHLVDSPYLVSYPSMAPDDAQRYHCCYCGCDITLRLKCAICSDFDLCLQVTIYRMLSCSKPDIVGLSILSTPKHTVLEVGEVTNPQLI